MRRQKIRKGLTVVSFLFLPVTLYYFSPALIIEGAFQGIVSGSFIFFGGLTLSSLFLRRGFCGWLCPGAGLQEACFGVRNNAVKGGKYNWIKYGIWVPWMGTVVLAAISAGGLRTVNPFLQTEYGISITSAASYPIYYLVLVLIVVPAFAIGKRAFCHYICWMAPFMVIGARVRDLFKWPTLHLESDKAKCINCKTCTKNCPMSLDVNAMVQVGSVRSVECILCGTCVDGCKQKSIGYSFS